MPDTPTGTKSGFTASQEALALEFTEDENLQQAFAELTDAKNAVLADSDGPRRKKAIATRELASVQ
eukprot:47221-Eustigmatos_ZCMA.PRE.1